MAGDGHGASHGDNNYGWELPVYLQGSMSLSEVTPNFASFTFSLRSNWGAKARIRLYKYLLATGARGRKELSLNGLEVPRLFCKTK